MADKPVSALPKVDSLSDGAMFAIEQDGKAYHATAEQVRNLIPGGGEGESTDLTGAVRYDQEQDLEALEKTQARKNIGAGSETEFGVIRTSVGYLIDDVKNLHDAVAGGGVLVLDLTGTVEVDSQSTDFNGQSFELSIDTEAVLSNTGLVAIDYTDMRVSGTLRAWLTSRKENPDGTGTTPVCDLYGVVTNPWTEKPAVFKLIIREDGTAAIVYRPTMEQESEDSGEDNRITGIDLTNMTEDFNGGSIVYTMEDGTTYTYTQGTDGSGNYTLTCGDHVVTLKGLS